MSLMAPPPTILLVEDDRNIAGALTEAIKSIYDIDTAPDGQSAIYKTDGNYYDLVILDLNLPDMNGLTICQKIRGKGHTEPILILTGESNVLTKIKLLDAGANDYLTKPFSLGELKARVRALLRSAPQTNTTHNQELSSYGLWLDRNSYKVSRDGSPINLRRKEFALLECLMANAGSVVSRTMLSRYAWQGDDGLWTNTVDVHIKHLRDKIDRPFGQNLIQTVHGIGYKLDAPIPISAVKAI